MSDDIRARVELALAARDEFPMAEFGSRKADALLFEFAEDILREIQQQDVAFVARTSRLPEKAAPVAVVDVSIRPKYRRRA